MTFTAATWNVFHGTPAPVIASTLAASRQRGVSVWLLQELSDPAARSAIRELGLTLGFSPRQYGIAWDPKVWCAVAPGRSERLGQTPYFRKGGGPEQFSDAHLEVLSDRLGRTLTALSYHAPPAVQRPNPPSARWKALQETAASWRRLANESQARACLFGGDDNVDERLRFGPWAFMLQAATGLRQVTASRPTHGKVRRIDDFRVRGLRPLGDGKVFNTASDHRIYEQRFDWR